MNIRFTQYLLPDGRKRAVDIERPDEICRKAAELEKLGLNLEIEILTTGVVSATVHNPLIEEDIAIELCPNGPGLTEKIDKLITEAYALATGIPI